MSAVMTSLQHGHGGQSVAPMLIQAQCVGSARSISSAWVPANSSLLQFEARTKEIIQLHDRSPSHKMMHSRSHLEQASSRPKSGCSDPQLDDFQNTHDEAAPCFASSLDKQRSDLLVEVGDMNFHLHKWPLSSKSGLIRRLLSSSEDLDHIQLEDMPGGSQTFELAANFCYGIAVEFNPSNVAALRCAAHYLEMTEELEPGNLSSKAEAFLSSFVLSSWQDSITALQCCESLHPWADKIHLITRLVESIASKACTDPSRAVGQWSYSDQQNMMSCSTPCTPRTSFRNDQLKHNTGASATKHMINQDWWFQDVASLSILYFTRVLAAIESKGIFKPQLIGAALEFYAHKWLPGTFKVAADLSSSKDMMSVVGSPTSKTGTTSNGFLNRSKDSSPTKGLQFWPTTKLGSESQLPEEEQAATSSKLHESVAEQDKNRETLQALVRMLPPEKDAVSCSFILGTLRAASMLNAGPEYKRELEKRAAMQLEQGTLSELLIPSFSHTSEHLYDVDLVRRILEHFLAQQDQTRPGTPKSSNSEKSSTRSTANGTMFEGAAATRTAALKLQSNSPQAPNLIRVAKIVESYLAEVARDKKLPVSKFQALAEALPEFMRISDDGLYRAIDTYLKAHPGLTEHERKKLCRVLDCQRLSLDACMHAAQNERLPLRTIVQVLFSEQVKLRVAITGITNQVVKEAELHITSSRLEAQGNSTATGLQTGTQQGEAPAVAVVAAQEQVNQKDIKALQRDLDAMTVKCTQLEKEYTGIHEQVCTVERLLKPPKPHSSSSWSSGWKKLSRMQIFHHHNKEEVMVPQPPRAAAPRKWRNSIS